MILTKEYIINNLYELPSPQGYIYFLLDKEEIVYIGQSFDPEKRIKQHRYDGKIFNSQRVVSCLLQDLSFVEYTYIKEFKPKYNIKQNNPEAYRVEYKEASYLEVIESNIDTTSDDLVNF